MGGVDRYKNKACRSQIIIARCGDSLHCRNCRLGFSLRAFLKNGMLPWKKIVDWEKSCQNKIEDNSRIYLEQDCNKMPDVIISYDLKQN